MYLSVKGLLAMATGAVLLLSCVDPEDLTLRGTVDIIVVDGTITNLPEPQVIRLNRSHADPLTGQFGVLPITKAIVQVIVDSALVIDCHETVDGSYQLPADFKGQVGHAYQLQFTLSNGTHYSSSQQLMPAVPPIDKLTLHFNPTSLPVGLLQDNFRAGFDVYIDTRDPPSQRNYYRWDWNLYEKQDWCQSCTNGYYMPNKLSLVSSYPNILVYQAQPDLLEDCFAAPANELFGGAHETTPLFSYDYVCRTQCWDIIHNSTINLFTDVYSNGSLIANRNVAQLPYYTQNPALVEVRQSCLTADAYHYFSLLQQTQNTGGLTDTPPTALIGNVRNMTNEQENVIGYFTTEATTTLRYFFKKNDIPIFPYGGLVYDPIKMTFDAVPGEQQLFFAFHRKLPQPEPSLNFTILGGSSRPPTALCAPSDNRTPFKPEGWQN